MSSGPCTVTARGACLRSPNYPNEYGANEDCAITVSGAGFVRATSFATWPGDDYVIIGRDRYDGDGGDLTAAGHGSQARGLVVSDGETISWHSDDRYHSYGFEVCGFDGCGEHGSSGGGTDCVCISGYTGAQCEVPPPQPFPDGFYESYTISGCSNSEHCGVFTRVSANCTSGTRGCPGGSDENSGSTDPSLCHGAPAYQHGGDDGPVLYRWMWGDGRTDWYVTDSSALEDCYGSTQLLHSLTIDPNSLPGGGGPPTAPAYSIGANWFGGSGWWDSEDTQCSHTSCGIAIVAGGH